MVLLYRSKMQRSRTDLPDLMNEGILRVHRYTLIATFAYLQTPGVFTAWEDSN